MASFGDVKVTVPPGMAGLPPGNYACEIKTVSERKDALGQVYMEMTVDFSAFVKAMIEASAALQKWQTEFLRKLGLLGRVMATCSPEDRVHAFYRAHCAEWLTLYLQAKGAVSTKRIKGAYRTKALSQVGSFNDLRDLAQEMGFLEGTTWRLPAAHPLA